MSNCKLNEHNIVKIVNQLQKVSTLKCLNFSYNEVTNQAAQMIVIVIDNNSGTIESLILCNCKLNEPDVENLIVSMKKIATLKHFDLSYNKIPDQISDEIASLISANAALKYLNLSKCRLSKIDIAKINNAARKRSKLFVKV